MRERAREIVLCLDHKIPSTRYNGIDPRIHACEQMEQTESEVTVTLCAYPVSEAYSRRTFVNILIIHVNKTIDDCMVSYSCFAAIDNYMVSCMRTFVDFNWSRPISLRSCLTSALEQVIHSNCTSVLNS